MRKKIAIITAGELPIPPVKGGAVENLVYSFAKMADQNQDFLIDIYGIGNESTKFSNIQMKYYTSRFYLQFIKIPPRVRNKCKVNPYLRYVCSCLRKNDYDYVIVENRFTYLRSVRKCTNAVICLHMHNSHLLPYTEEKEQAINNCDMVIAVSEFIKKEIITHYPKALAKTVVWYNGIDVKKFSRRVSAERIRYIKEKYGIKPSDKVIAYTGRIIEEKGVLELVKAFHLVKKSIACGCKLMLIGSSWYGNMAEMSDYEKKVLAEANISKDDIIFTGYINNDVLPEYLISADILVYPSLWNEPFGLTIVEGLSTGKPVVSIANGGIPEIYALCGTLTQNMLVSLGESDNNIAELLYEKIIFGINNNSYSTINFDQITTMQECFSKEKYYQRAKELFI